MLQSKRNELTQSILKKMKQQGPPTGTVVDLELGQEDEIPSEHEPMDYMGTQVREMNPMTKKFLPKGKKRKAQEALAGEDDVELGY